MLKNFMQAIKAIPVADYVAISVIVAVVCSYWLYYKGVGR